MTMDIVLVAGGLGILVLGGEMLTLNASRIALNLGLKPIVIGLTIVAFGTSMPEALISVTSAMDGKGDIVIANMAGSNIFNILLILGLAAIIHPLKVERNAIRREIPFLIGSSILALILSYDGVVGRLDGLVLLGFFATFLIILFRSISNEPDEIKRIQSGRKYGWVIAVTALSLVLLVIGAKTFLTGSISIARHFGVAEAFIGLIIIAVGTSLPEFATSVIASFRGKDDIAVGNIVGSNIFNVLFILGISSIIHPVAVSDLLIGRDLVILIAVSLAALPILKTGFRISRIEGLGLLCGYAFYLQHLFRAG